jgi:hypothetical protein
METARKTSTGDLPTDYDPMTADVTAIENNANDKMTRYKLQMQMRTAPAWRPAPDTTMYGVVVAMAMGESGFGEYPIITYKLEDGSYVRIHAFHTLLRDKLSELKTDVGSEQFVTYLGLVLKNSSKDKPEAELEATDRYHMYDVADATTV